MCIQTENIKNDEYLYSPMTKLLSVLKDDLVFLLLPNL